MPKMKSVASQSPPPVRPRRMLAATIVEPQRLRVERVDVPEPSPGQVRVRLEGCGVCASNLPPWQGRPWFQYPFAPGQLGHEGWGWIDALGEGVGNLRVGQRVAMLSDRAYAEFDVTGVEKVVPLPDALADRPFPGEPLGCATNIFARSGISAGQTVGIVGLGFLGSLLTQMATRCGARVIAVAHRPFSQQVARQMGAQTVIPMDDHQRIIARVGELTGGRFCDVVVEAVGSQWPLDLAGELTRERGRVVVAGYHQDGPRQVNMQLWNWRGLDVINAHEREVDVYVAGMRAAIDAVVAGQLDPWALYTHRFPLDGLDRALADTERRPDGFMKALIAM